MLTESQLLQCVRISLKRAAATEDNGEKESLLSASDIVLNELLLRLDNTFFHLHYQRGYLLADQGLALIRTRKLNLPAADTLEGLPDKFDESAAIPLIEESIQKLTDFFQGAIRMLPASGDDEVTVFLDAVNQWETDLYGKRMEEVPLPDSALINGGQPEITAGDFEQYLRKKFPERGDIRVTAFSPLHGGFSKQTIMVDTEDKVNGQQSLVLRVQQDNTMMELYAGQIREEYPIVKLAYEAGARLSEPLWMEGDKTHLGNSFLVSRRAPGRNLGSATGATEPVTGPMVKSFAEEIVKVHNIDLVKNIDRIRGTVLEPWLESTTITEVTAKHMKFWRSLTERYQMDASTLVERGLRWLEDNIEPCDDKPVLTHGDYGIHNVLVHGENVSAILDWEVSHIGDPAEEISWFLACTADAVDRDQFLHHYKEAGGKPFSEYRLRYFDVLNCLKLPLCYIASVAALNRYPDSIRLAVFALRYVHHGASRMIDAIKRAEEIKPF
jgi:aminoglycoside phosphotransferase (APT) family kinase protein